MISNNIFWSVFLSADSFGVQVQVQVQQSLLSHMKYIQLINSIYIWCNNEGHWSISLFGPLLRYTFLISFHDNSFQKKKKKKKKKEKGK